MQAMYCKGKEMLAIFLLLVASLNFAESRRVIRAASGSNTTGNYIVVVSDGTNHTRFLEIADRVKNESINSKVYEQVEGPFANIIAAKMTEDAAHRLKTLENVDYVEEETYAVKSTSWALDRIDQTESTLDNAYTPEGNGKGVDVYILDTGIHYTHNDFGGRAKYPGFDPVDTVYRTSYKGRDCHGHGTHVASIAVGKRWGVAKNADVYSVRVLDCNGLGPWSIIIDGLNRVAERVKANSRPAVISMSLGGSFSNAGDRTLKSILGNGIPIVAAAGNERDDACKYSPASTSGVITVGGTEKGDSLYYYTNGGSCVDVFAPGSAVTAASYKCNTCSVTYSGTSMAAPIVSGSVAIHLQNNSKLTPSQVKDKIIQDSLKNKLNYDNMNQGLRGSSANRLLHVKPKSEPKTVTVTSTNTQQLTVTQTTTSVSTSTTTAQVTTTQQVTTTIVSIVPTTVTSATTTSISVTSTATLPVTAVITSTIPVMVTVTPTPTPEEVCCLTLRNFNNLEERMINNVSGIVNSGIESIKNLLNPNSNNDNTSKPNVTDGITSCADLLNQSVSSGYYYIRGSNKTVSVYCDLDKEIKGSKGFMRIANINMSNPNTDCPNGLSLRRDGDLRTCQRSQIHSGCSTVNFSSSNVKYSRVCGRIRGYQWASPNAFYYTTIYSSAKIEDNYVDGVVLTNQVNNTRSHIWTFAAAIDEVGRNKAFSCQCSNVNVTIDNFKTPPFVGDDYFCETGSRGKFSYGVLYTDDPLWDGKGCGEVSSCCDKGEWFCKDVPKTSSDIELRLCGNEPRFNEDTPLELIELYVQ